MVFFSNKLTIGALLGCDIMGFNGMGLGKTQGKIFTGNNVFFHQIWGVSWTDLPMDPMVGILVAMQPLLR